MKNYLSALSVLVVGFFVLSAFSLRELPQDPPRGQKKHIKIVKMEDGEKTVIDTVISGENIFMLKGDSTKSLKWITKELGDLDELKDLDFDFDFDCEEGKDGHKVIMFMSKDGDKHMVKEFKFGDDEAHGNVFIHCDKDLKKVHADHMIWTTKKGHAPHVNVIRKKVKGNVIDLSDPGIISFKKKKMSDGREKIEIIRKEVKEDELHEVDVDVIIDEIHGAHGLHEIHEGHPTMVKKIKVISDDSGVVRIFEDGKESEFLLKDIGEGVKEIREDGKIIRIKKIKKGDKEEVEVEVEVEVEKKEGHE